MAAVSESPFKHVYEHPVAGMCMSWSSAIAGTVAMLAVPLLLTVLAFAIVLLATTPASIPASAVAMAICASCLRLVGALAGGFVAAYLAGSMRRPTAVAHALLSWALALIVSSLIVAVVMRGVALGLLNVMSRGGGVTLELGPLGRPILRSDAAGIGALAGLSWLWFGSWLLSAIVAVFGAMMGIRRLASRAPAVPRAPIAEERERPIGPMTPAPTT